MIPTRSQICSISPNKWLDKRTDVWVCSEPADEVAYVGHPLGIEAIWSVHEDE